MVDPGCGQPCRSDADAELFAETILSLDGVCRSDCSRDAIPALGAQYYLGVDGFGYLMILLTVVVGWL